MGNFRTGPGKPMTSGEVARMLHVATRTVCKWCDERGLKFYRVPGGRDRRIWPADLAEWLTANGSPIPAKLTEPQGIQLTWGLETDERLARAHSPYDLVEAGRIIERHEIDTAIVGDRDGMGSMVSIVRHVADRSPKAHIVVVLSEGATFDERLRPGHVAWYRPFSWQELIQSLVERERKRAS